MTKPGKTPKKKTKEKSPQRTEESEYPAMDEETYNRLLRNAIEHSKAELEAKLQQQHWHEEQLKAVEERLTKKFDDEVRELSQSALGWLARTLILYITLQHTLASPSYPSYVSPTL